jgi:ubiquinol-cytochrome c reductase cytochrome c1 subunit
MVFNSSKNSAKKSAVRLSLQILACTLLAFGLCGAGHQVHAAEGGHKHPLPNMDWSFEGPLGTYDRAALQRGFLVYKQVCSACHGLKKKYYRNLEALGYSEAQIKSIAAEYTVMDGPNDEGEMFERPARPSDKFKQPYANDKAAMYANNGALPVDLSLIVKARHGGADYVYGLLTGYTNPPEGFVLGQGQHYNKYKDGNIIAMANPLSDGQITYEDGTPQTLDQYAKDVTHFLAWAAEPELEERKQMGFKVILFLIAFAAVMYLVKRKIWEDVKH